MDLTVFAVLNIAVAGMALFPVLKDRLTILTFFGGLLGFLTLTALVVDGEITFGYETECGVISLALECQSFQQSIPIGTVIWLPLLLTTVAFILLFHRGRR